MNRFPPDFIFGAATSAYQIEGAHDEDGRGRIGWDDVARDAAGRPLVENGDVACDHYHRFRGDIAIMKELGLQSYRFSISWVRIYPLGHGNINPKGVAFYNALIDELLENGIEPAVTVWHGDLPSVYDEIGGWKNRDVITHYVAYANTLFTLFGDRVKKWFTHNEPWCAAFLPAGSFSDQLQSAHNLLVAHALAVASYRAHPQGDGQIGIVLNLGKQYPASDDPLDLQAARNVDGFLNRWFLDPVLKGNYPVDMVDRYERAGHHFVICPGDMELLGKQPSDFIGINMYSRGIQAYDPDNQLLGAREVRDDAVRRTAMGWEICPESLYDLLLDVKREYLNIPVIIAENGAAFADEVIFDGQVRDDDRIAYFRDHLRFVSRAIAAGCDVRGYYAWSLFDNFEWGAGYSKRFGIVRVDYATQKRSIKESGIFYQNVIRLRAVE